MLISFNDKVALKTEIELRNWSNEAMSSKNIKNS